MEKEEKRVLEIEDVLLLLPHRYPFLLIDGVDDWREGSYIRAHKGVTVNENFFQGHFPHYKVMPGVLQIEMAAQAASMLEILGSGWKSGDVDVRFVKVEEARFFKEVRPGCVLDVYVEETRRKGMFRWGSGEVSVGGEKVMSVKLVALFSKRGGEERGGEEGGGEEGGGEEGGGEEG